MATLEQRLAKLEATRTRRSPEDDRQQAAIHRLVIALREALPDDRPGYAEGHPIYEVGHQWHADKVRALAGRIEAGGLGEEDRMLLESLPHDALECLDMTAPELVAMLERVEAMY
jgi:hypothetical protein